MRTLYCIATLGSIFGLTLSASADTKTSLQATIAYGTGQLFGDTFHDKVSLFDTGAKSAPGFPFGNSGDFAAEVRTQGQLIHDVIHASGELVGSVYTYPASVGVNSALSYSFQVVGPANANVPVIVITPDPIIQFTSTDGTMFGMDGTATATLSALTYNQYSSYGDFSESSYLSKSEGNHAWTQSDTFKPKETFSMVANDQTTIMSMTSSISVAGHVLSLGGGNYLTVTNTGKLIFDPIVEIDPSFANAADYHIVFSDGITNPVPEPASMLALGGCVLALVRRRRK